MSLYWQRKPPATPSDMINYALFVLKTSCTVVIHELINACCMTIKYYFVVVAQ